MKYNYNTFVTNMHCEITVHYEDTLLFYFYILLVPYMLTSHMVLEYTYILCMCI